MIITSCEHRLFMKESPSCLSTFPHDYTW
jgi:hypothetical protein